jgi:uncharacterized protein involved in exopolysaccharide biosynthesis
MYGLRIALLGLCITCALALRADAQQNSSNANPNAALIQDLREDIYALRQQVEPLRSQVQQLLAKVKTLREKLAALEQKMKDDYAKIQVLQK